MGSRAQPLILKEMGALGLIELTQRAFQVQKCCLHLTKLLDKISLESFSWRRFELALEHCTVDSIVSQL